MIVVPVSSADGKADRAVLSLAVANWCVLEDSLSDKSVKELDRFSGMQRRLVCRF